MVAGTFRLPIGYQSVAPLQQINLKVPPAAAAHWKAQAAAQGLSVRDWLLAITTPSAAGPRAGPGADPGLADRVAQLEAVVADLVSQVEQLRAPRRPSSRVPRAAAAESPVPVPEVVAGPPVLRPAELPAPTGAIPTAELAERIGMKRGTLNERLRRMGGAREGLEVGGWRCSGQVALPTGGPPRWIWVPAES